MMVVFSPNLLYSNAQRCSSGRIKSEDVSYGYRIQVSGTKRLKTFSDMIAITDCDNGSDDNVCSNKV